MKLAPAAALLLIYVGAGPAQAAGPDDPPAWTGSEISLKHSFSVRSFMPGFEPDFNPVLVQSLGLDPAWRLTDRLRLTGHLGIETELTDSDVSSYERQPLIEDTTATAAYTLPPLPAELRAVALFRLTLPTSKESIARRRVAAFAPGVTVSRELLPRPDVRVTPFVTLRATYHWQLSTSLVYDGPTITTCSAARGDSCEEFEHSGIRSPVASFVEILGVRVELPRRVSLAAQIWWVQTWLYDLAPAHGPMGEPIASRPGGTDWRMGNLYLLAADWQLSRRWKLEGGLQTENPQQRPDGSYHAPFFNRHTQLFVTAAAVF